MLGTLVGAVFAAPVLEQKKIHAEYNEGNFEHVTAALEGFMAQNKTYNKSDSVFIAKHLAVVYTANPATREKGKYYMYKLLELLPSAKLVDMYVSDEIDRIFEKVREEFVSRQQSFGVDTLALTVPSKAPANESAPQSTRKENPQQHLEKSASKSSTVYWLAGGAVVVAASVVTYLVFNTSDEPKDMTYVVP